MNKGGYDISGDVVRGDAQAAADGNAVAFMSVGSFAGSRGGAQPSVYLARRTGGGTWVTRGLSPSQRSDSIGYSSRIFSFTDDLARGVFTTNMPQASDAADVVDNIYVRDNITDQFSLRSLHGFSTDLFGRPVPQFGGASSDLSTVAFSSWAPLTPDAPLDFSMKVYVGSERQLKFVSLLPGEIPAAGGAALGSGSNLMNAVSDTGDRVYFTSPVPGDLYTRSGNMTELVASGGQFWGASSNGASVLFGQSGELVRRDVRSGVSTILSPDEETTDGTDPGFLGVLAATQDLSVAYFTAMGQLVRGQPSNPDVSGAYLYRTDGDGVRYIASLSSGAPDNSLTLNDPAVATSRAISSDGARLLFVSSAPLTAAADGVHPQVYLYDAASDRLTCVSCASAGPVVDAALFGTLSGGSVSWFHDRRNITADGRRAFFQTAAALVPGDSNGTIDVYEWSDGRASLISSGTGGDDARFLDASPSGDDVFFATRAQLVPSDRDRLVDVYDARVGGGEPTVQPPAPACADAATCRGIDLGGDGPTTPTGSETFFGAGNATEQPRRSLVIGSVTRSTLAKAARSGVLVVRIEASFDARVSVRATSPLGAKRAQVVVARTARQVRAKRSVSMRLALSKRARRRLHAQRALPLLVRVTASGANARQLRVTLRSSEMAGGTKQAARRG